MPNGDNGTPPIVQPQPQQPPVNKKHALIGKVFETLAGGARSEYAVDPETGQTRETKVPLKPGEMWRGILAAGLTGMMAGAGEYGTGAPARAFQKGGTAVIAEREKATQQAREQAQTDFKNKMAVDEVTLRKHADARDQMRLDADLKEHTLRLAGLQLENKDKDLNYKSKLINMEQGFADTIDRIKLLGGKPAEIGGRPAPEFDSPEEFYQFRAENKDARSADFKPVFNPDTGKYQIYAIPDPDKPISPELAKKIETIYGIKPVAGANTIREVYAWLNRPGAAEEARKRNLEEAQVKEAEARTGTAKAEEGAARARADYERSRIAQVKKSDEAYQSLADVELKLSKGENVDPKVLAKARPVIREQLKMWLGNEQKAIKDAESGDPDAKAALTEATAQRQKWERIWDADKGIKPAGKGKVVDGVTVPAGKDVIYDGSGTPHMVDEDKVEQYLADPQYKGWSKTKPKAAPGIKEKLEGILKKGVVKSAAGEIRKLTGKTL